MREQHSVDIAATVREHDVHLGGLIHVNPLAILVIDATITSRCAIPRSSACSAIAEADIIGRPVDSLIVPDGEHARGRRRSASADSRARRAIR